MNVINDRFFWLVSLGTLVIVCICAVIAIGLFRQQATVASVFRENVASRRAAVELEECLTDLIALEEAHVESVAALHDRIGTHLLTLTEVADQPVEFELQARISSAFTEYLRRWDALPPTGHPDHDAARRAVTHFLEVEVLRPCTEFRLYNGRRLEQATEAHEAVLGWLGWGMAGIAVLGGVAGLVLGFGVARGLRRSIRRLQVRIRDATGKLGPDLPEIVVTGEGDFRDVHAQVDHLTTRIEGVVKELQLREQEVLRAEQLAAVGQLAAGVGHEIRNPLTSIKLLVQTGLEADTSGLTTEDLRIIEGEIRKVERSLQTFLDFTRPGKPERRPVELVELVTTVVGLTRGRAERQRVSVRVYTPPDGLRLVADGGQIQQVLVNLVLNALDAMPTGGVLHLIVRRAGDQIEVEVADTGHGIAPEMRPRLFQPFASSKDTGLGLGLVISRRIAEDHGGTLIGANRAGGGASFTLSLPAGEEQHRE